MKSKFTIYFFSILTIFLLSVPQAFSGGSGNNLDFIESDTSEDALAAFFDLRDRETYIQVTNTGVDLNTEDDDDSGPVTVHVQIFNVDQDCNENNFFDTYTAADTHVYNMRDILTNDGSPSGVVLPEGAYGIVFIAAIDSEGDLDSGIDMLIGNLRIMDNSGYEYRTNIAADPVQFGDMQQNFGGNTITLNFNTAGGVTLSDVVGFVYTKNDDAGEIEVSNILDNFAGFDIDILNNNEVPQSCRNVIFACVDQDNPLLEELLSGGSGDSDDDDFSASVASFEYGINEAIPHSKGGELLCPGNITSEGFVKMEFDTFFNEDGQEFVGYIGLNNGNGRGSLDSFWFRNGLFPQNMEASG